ncbi:arylsulfotransferase family protein [Marinobacterium sp. YM272]|uniref:arylsulfotransferase family protein n=1 Tax=Marinobacterium sp. YM272 TaxID=3421654 RepID=UPI003D7FFF37
MYLSQTGVLHHDQQRATPGFTLVGGIRGFTVNLIDNFGSVVHSWRLPGRLGSYARLLPGGNLLASVVVEGGFPGARARGGRIIELNWDGEVVWEFTDPMQHHDIRRLPNGNTLYIGWQPMQKEQQVRVQGGIPGSEPNGVIHEDYIREITPAGEVVWNWSASQLEIESYPIASGTDRGEFAHCNTINPIDDEHVMVCFRNTNTIGIIERASGNMVWKKQDHHWGHPHDPQILRNGNILLFCNGAHDEAQPHFSYLVELDRQTGDEVWRYQAPIPWHFYSHVMSGANELPSGNLLVIQSAAGRVFEITRAGEVVWDYVNPVFEGYFPTAKRPVNCVFRAFRYQADSPELEGRVLV